MASSVATISQQYKIPQRVFPINVHGNRSVTDRFVSRLEIVRKKRMIWLIQKGIGKKLLCDTTDQEFAVQLNALQGKIQKMKIALRAFDISSKKQMDMITDMISGNSLNARFINNCVAIGQVFSEANLSGTPRLAAKSAFMEFFAAPAQTRSNVVAAKILYIVRAEDRLSQVIDSFEGIKREALKVNSMAIHNMARIIVAMDTEFIGYIKAVKDVAVEAGGKTFYPLASLEARLRTCVGISVATLEANARYLIGNYGFTQVVFDTNPNILNIESARINDSTIALAFLNTAQYLVAKDKIDLALGFIGTAESYARGGRNTKFITAIRYFGRALRLFRTAKIMQSGTSSSAAVQEKLREAYAACLKGDAKHRMGKESAVCFPIAARIKRTMAEVVLEAYARKAAQREVKMRDYKRQFSRGVLCKLNLDELMQKTQQFFEMREEMIAIREKEILLTLLNYLRHYIVNPDSEAIFILKYFERVERMATTQEAIDMLNQIGLAAVKHLIAIGHDVAGIIEDPYLARKQNIGIAANLILCIHSHYSITLRHLKIAPVMLARQIATAEVDHQFNLRGLRLLLYILKQSWVTLSAKQLQVILLGKFSLQALTDVVDIHESGREIPAAYLEELCRWKKPNPSTYSEELVASFLAEAKELGVLSLLS
ncbi:MAG: hypothetical protein KKB81_01880 [Candidatus Margulisbacteria bacterium]|nr:hypothetical protein [Candidatus Margulisiibacteriota bacterium]MBU1021666.1 hypothetical protein [Candidatus Margulisiibacteriota bacterium]MBU1728816.1 hypothetical protein [Candidatus Margulisiibacteriota bacterium]MBU1955782.1 hypothetical protein [Candidatus Margulisiibacteriota bacterium]